MKLKKPRPSSTRPQFKLSHADERQLKKMGLGGVVRDLKRAAKGKSTAGSRKVDRLLPPTTKLNEVFGSVSPRLDPKLFGGIVARFWSSTAYAVSLTNHLHELARINGRSRRADLKLLLEVILEVPLAAQRRQIEGLRRDIPKLLKQLEPKNSHRRGKS